IATVGSEASMEITEEVAGRVLSEIDPSERLQAVNAFVSSDSTVVEIVCCSGRALVVKTYPVERPWHLHHEAFVYSLIRTQTTIPMPEVVLCDDSKRLVPLDYAVMTRLPGTTMASLAGLSGDDVADLYRQMALSPRLARSD